MSNLYLDFARQDGKKQKENHGTNVTIIPKTKRRKYGMKELIKSETVHMDLLFLPQERFDDQRMIQLKLQWTRHR